MTILDELAAHARERVAAAKELHSLDELKGLCREVGKASGEGHHQDVHEQVAVDDPAGLAQLDPG